MKFAYDYEYSVSGENEDGDAVDGTVYSNSDDKNVSGEITDEDGSTYEFEGEWDGYGHITGETDDGEEIELDVD